MLLPGGLARGVLPPGVLPASHHSQLHHLGEGEVRGEPGKSVHTGGQGVRGEVLALYVHL